MHIFRAELTPHPRGSLSAPALSEYYLMPPLALTCTAVSHVPDQAPVPATTASLRSCAVGSQSSPTPHHELIPDTERDHGTATGSTDTSLLRRPQGKLLTPQPLKRLISAAVLVAGIVAALLITERLFQSSGLAEDPSFTEAALRPLVDKSPSEPRGASRNYPVGVTDEGETTHIMTGYSETDEGENESTESIVPITTSTRRSQNRTRRRRSSSSRRSRRRASRTNVGSHRRARSSKKTSRTLHLTTTPTRLPSSRRKGKQSRRHHTKKVKQFRHSRTAFDARHGRLLAVTREGNRTSSKKMSLPAAVLPRVSSGNSAELAVIN